MFNFKKFIANMIFKKVYNRLDPSRQMTKQEKQEAARVIGFVAGIFSKALLQAGGCDVDFKINGEDISTLKKLEGMDISERIKLAVKEERYEDAAKLKKLLEHKP